MEDGAMVCKNKGNIWTVAGYSDFVLEFKLDKKQTVEPLANWSSAPQ